MERGSKVYKIYLAENEEDTISVIKNKVAELFKVKIERLILGKIGFDRYKADILFQITVKLISGNTIQIYMEQLCTVSELKFLIDQNLNRKGTSFVLLYRGTLLIDESDLSTLE